MYPDYIEIGVWWAFGNLYYDQEDESCPECRDIETSEVDEDCCWNCGRYYDFL